MRPSYLAAGMNGVLMAGVVILALIYWSIMDGYQKVMVISLISVQLGVHAILHHIEEIYYDFNPLEGKWSPLSVANKV
uniref:Fatty acid desaturase n=1 Tax=viral metagenome TaxID=1070528 RepID=A0A6C0BLM1_9ZZZZ